MQAEDAASLCSQLAEILEAGTPNRLRIKQLKGIELAFRSDPRLRADVQARLGSAIDGIEDYWAALETCRRARELDAVRYRAFSCIQALEATARLAAVHGVLRWPLGGFPRL